MSRGLSRRTALRGAAGAAVALPMLDVMRPARAAFTYPKRLVIVFSSCGTIAPSWNPTGGTTDFKLSPILAPLEPHRGEVVILRGIDNVTGKNQNLDNQHDAGMSHLLTCTPLRSRDGRNGITGAASVDQFVGQKLGTDTKFRTLELGVLANGIEYIGLAARMCYTASGHSIPPENNPGAAYDRLFHDLGAPASASANKLRKRRQRVLDLILDDYRRLIPQLGKEDRERVDAHLSALAQTERQLLESQPMGNLSLGCVKPTRQTPENHNVPQQTPDIGRIQMDLLVSALTCDLTRVATLQWSRAESDLKLPWIGVTRDTHHGLSHLGDSDGPGQSDLVTINNWYAQQFASLLARMKAVKEGDGTLLDNSVVVWANEMGKGNSHSLEDVPFVLAGKAGGSLKTGRYLQYSAMPHNNLWVSVLNALGIPTTVYGDATVCTGPLPDL